MSHVILVALAISVSEAFGAEIRWGAFVPIFFMALACDIVRAVFAAGNAERD